MRWMRMVVAVAEERNFSRAAMRCHISQPALSRRIKDVEAIVGIRLFERRTRSVSITKAGQLFVREARRTLEQGNRTVSLIQALAKSEETPASIGLSALADSARLLSLIEKSVRTTPNLSIVTRTAVTPELLRDLQRGDLDVALIDLPARVRGIRLASLFSEPLIAALPESLARAKQTTISGPIGRNSTFLVNTNLKNLLLTNRAPMQDEVCPTIIL